MLYFLEYICIMVQSLNKEERFDFISGLIGDNKNRSTHLKGLVSMVETFYNETGDLKLRKVLDQKIEMLKNRLENEKRN